MRCVLGRRVNDGYSLEYLLPTSKFLKPQI